MKLKVLFALLLSLLTITLVGCGDDNGGGGSGQVIRGVVDAGLVRGGTVQVFQILSSGTKNARLNANGNIPRIGPMIASGPTGSDGSYAVAIPAGFKKDGLKVVVTNGKYRDEATGLDLDLNTQTAGLGLSAVFDNISGAVKRGENVVVNVTPFTYLGSEALAAVPTDAAIVAANAKVKTTFANLLAGVDIIKTTPDSSLVASVASKAYASALATLSSLQRTNGQTLDQQVGLGSTFLTEVLTGVIDPQTTITVPAPPAPVVTVTPATATTATINTPVTITANVKVSGVNAPSGTVVTFAIKSGVAGTLSTASALTTGSTGNATVTLTSATIGASYIVTATTATSANFSGFVSADSAVITIVQNPNLPTAVSVSATPNPASINSSVALTATVTPGTGGTIANGTVVTFATSAGTLSAITTTTGGVATATLSGVATAQTVTVTATAGGITSPVVSVVFTNPNLPGAITLSAPATSAINSPVTLTATVTPVSPSGTLPVGTPVTFTVLTGTGTISAVTTTNAAGVATATLNSAVAGTVTARATAGTAPVVSSNIVSVQFSVLLTKAILKLSTTGTLPVGTSIGSWDADIAFPATVTINNGVAGALVAPAFALSGTDTPALVAGLSSAALNAADAAHGNLPFVSALFAASGTGIGVLGEVATITFNLVTPTATPTLTAANFILNPTNVNSTAVGAPTLKPGVDLSIVLSFQ